MRRLALLVVAALAVGCKKEPPNKLALTSARALGTGPAKPKFGDQTRPPVAMQQTMQPPRERTPEEWRAAFEVVCNERGRCDKYLVSAEIQAAPEPMAKELTKRCWDVRKAVTLRLKSYATELANLERTSRANAGLSAAGCVDVPKASQAAFAKAEETYRTFDAQTPELADMRAALDATGKCNRCDPEHVARCDDAKKLILELAKTAAAKQDPYCKDLLKPAGSSK